MIIDAHAHIYPQKIASKATTAIGDFYSLNMEIKEGTADRLVKVGSEIGVSKYVVHSCATKPEQVRAINEFIKGEMNLHSEFIGFMTLHQDLSEKEMAEEIEWCITNGFKGIKLHPDFQKFYIDGENAQKIYNTLNSFNVNMPILIHTGDKRYQYSMPERLSKMAKQYKKINFIGAHFGGYSVWDRVSVYKGQDNVFFDTSSSLAFLDEKQAKDLIMSLGREKFFFGTDFPMWTAKEEYNRLLALGLNDGDLENILANNFIRLMSK